MARPKKDGLGYFPHDTDACHDQKVQVMRVRFGLEGYGFYFMLLEAIYRTTEGSIPIADQDYRDVLIRETGLTPERFEDMLQKALEVGLFDKQSYTFDGLLTSNGVKSRVEEVQCLRSKDRSRKQIEFSGGKPLENSGFSTGKHPETPPQKEKEKEIKELTDSEFESFWTRYPRKINKTGAQRAWHARKTDKSLDPAEVMRGLENYLKTVAGKEVDFVMHPSTFLGPSRRWKDYLTPGPKFVPASLSNSDIEWTCEQCGTVHRNTGHVCTCGWVRDEVEGGTN